MELPAKVIKQGKKMAKKDYNNEPIKEQIAANIYVFGVEFSIIGEHKKTEIEIEAKSEEDAFGLLPEIVKEKYSPDNWFYNGYFKIKKK